MGREWGLRTSDISELETQMQEIQKHNQNRITTVDAEVTQSRWCFVTDADRLLQRSTHDRSGYALWTYLNTPFFLAMQGFEVEEVAPWIEGNDRWRVLRAKFPANIASHSSNQDFYFGPDFLLRRHDYQVDIAGSFPAAQYVYDLQDFAGFWFPKKRRAHPRNANLTAEKHRTYVWIDVAEVAVGEED